MTPQTRRQARHVDAVRRYQRRHRAELTIYERNRRAALKSAPDPVPDETEDRAARDPRFAELDRLIAAADARWRARTGRGKGPTG
jgi:hypothetical protein